MSGARKFIRFAAPYRSKTFNDKDSILVGKNGVMSGGEVTQSGLVVTVAPISFIQDGLIVKTEVALSASVPTGLQAPYFIAVSVSTAIENLAEVITPVFVKRPQDVNSQVVLIAEYDGVEWRQLPRLQTKTRIKELETQTVRTGLTGVTSGFEVALNGSNYEIEKGTLIASDGTDVLKDEPTVIPYVAAPAAGTASYDRVDYLVFRKPQDSEARVGTIKNIVGPAFSGVAGTHVEAALTSGAAAATNVKTTPLRGTTNTLVTFIEGTTLKFLVVADDHTLVTPSALTVATLVDDYDMTSNYDNSIDFVYTRTTDLFHKRITATNVIVYAESTLYTSLLPLFHPQIECLGVPTSYVSHIAVCRELGASNREIAYLRMASDGSIATPYTSWISLLSTLEKPHLVADQDDSLLFMSYENTDTGRAYLRTYDGSTATPTSAPTEISGSVELQTEVYNQVTSTLMPSTGASDTKIVVTDNKEVFVFWKHFKAVGQHSVAVYNNKFKATFGRKAYILENTDIDDFDVAVDGMNRSYMSLDDGTDIMKAVFDLERLNQIGTTDTVFTASVNSPKVTFMPRGDLLHVFGNVTGSNLSLVRSTAAVLTTLRDQHLTSSDVYLAYYRTSDQALAVSDVLAGEERVLERLYEFFHIYAASGVVSWNVAGSNKLVNSAINLRFLNRQSTYTMAASGPGGITIPLNNVLYVEIPDEDVTTNLTPIIKEFGKGTLDREGKKAFPLFWNVGGRLYSSFAPYSFSDGGETVIIGGTVSEEMIAWLGSGSSAPDANNHAYSSTTYILQSDSLNTAIGKLDAAITGVVTGGTAGLIPLAVGTTNVVVTFGSPRSTAAYRLTSTFENTVDAEPMIQPHIISTKATTGFIISWPSELDTNNYILDFILRDTV